MNQRSPRTNTSIRLRWSVAVVVVAALLVGCSSDASDADADSATTTTEGPFVATTAEPTDSAPEGTTTSEATDPASLGGAVVYTVHDKYTIFDDGPGTVVLAGKVEVGVLRPGDGLELLDGGPDTGTTILAIRVGAPGVAVESLAAGEFGDIVVAGELEDFAFDSKLVRPID